MLILYINTVGGSDKPPPAEAGPSKTEATPQPVVGAKKGFGGAIMMALKRKKELEQNDEEAQKKAENERLLFDGKSL